MTITAFGHPGYTQEFTFRFEPPKTPSEQWLMDKMQQDSSGSKEYTDFITAEESDAMFACLVLRTHFILNIFSFLAVFLPESLRNRMTILWNHF